MVTEKKPRRIRKLEPITEAPYKPRILARDPEADLAKIFEAIGADCGGKIGATVGAPGAGHEERA